MILLLASAWSFCRPITLLVTPLPIFLYLNIGIFLVPSGVFCSTLLPNHFFGGIVGWSIGFLSSIHYISSYISGYQTAAHCLLQLTGVSQTYT